MEERVVPLPINFARQLHERCWSATSKLESQIVRNPDLPKGYKDFVAASFESLRQLDEYIKAADPNIA